MMRRDLKQAWTGMILREGFPISLDNLAIIHRECIKSSHNFLDREGFHYHDLTFEDLINNPEKSIYGINQFIGIHLDISDLREIYRGPLYKSRWTKRDFFKAKLKFLYYKHISRDIIRFPRKKYS